MPSAKAPVGSALELAEGDVRRLCGAATFARADHLQQAGHVLVPSLTAAAALTASVVGTWRRVDEAIVTPAGGRLSPSCSCGVGGFCQHVGALLLHWLRDRGSFVPAAPAPASPPVPGTTQPAVRAPGWLGAEEPFVELRLLLDADTVAHLRGIARRRGVAQTSRGKDELLDALVPALAAPGNVDVALALLGPDERRALDAVHLGSTQDWAREDAVTAAYRVLGGQGDPALDVLLDQGLAVATPKYGYGPRGYRVPYVVASRLPPLSDLARPLAGDQPPSPGRSRRPRLDVVELLEVVALELAGRDIRRRPASRQDHDYAYYVPHGWRIDPVVLAQHDAVELVHRSTEARLMPASPLLGDADLARLAGRTGQTTDAVAFAVHVMAALGIVEGADRLLLREDRLWALLGLASADRLARLSQAWLALDDWSELALIFGDAGPFEVRCRLAYMPGRPFLPAATAIRSLLARLVGRVAPDAWLDLGSLAGTVQVLMPDVRPASAHGTGWWLYERGGRERLDLEAPAGQTRLWRALVAAVLSGPLAWLGLVDVDDDTRPTAFRARPAAGVLVGREVPADADEPAGQLVVDVDPSAGSGQALSVLVPAGTSDATVHATLGRIGELVEASPTGLRYRLTPERAQAAFDAGLTGPEVVRFLADRAAGRLPDVVETTIAHWWSGYGTVHLYDEVCLVELGDDFLLAELLAATPLATALVHTFSPRLIAVDPMLVDELLGHLARLGHTPRVVEGS